jgi:hypothetical protein
MNTLLALLDSYIFSGITSSIAWEILKSGWQKANQKSWEYLYLESFSIAVQKMQIQLMQYTVDGVVELDNEDLHRALKYELAVDITSKSFNDVGTSEFVKILSEALFKKQVIIIGGNNLSQDDYINLISHVIQQAREIFRNSILTNEFAFRQAVIADSQSNHAYLSEIFSYIKVQFNFLEQKIDNLSATKALNLEDVIKQSHKQLIRYFREITKKEDGLRPVFDNELYVPRTDLEIELNNFMRSKKSGFLLVGNSGAGKTNSLSALTNNLHQQKHAVFFYDLGSSVRQNIFDEISDDLETPKDELTRRLEQISILCEQNHKYIVFIFDGINAFRAGNRSLAGLLLSEIDNFISRNQNKYLKVIISCRKSTWEQFELIGQLNLIWHNYYENKNKEKWFLLSEFSDQELSDAFSKYQKIYKLFSGFSELSDYTRKRCKDPFVLRLLSETHENKKHPIPTTAPYFDIYEQYFEAKVKTIATKHFIETFVETIIYQKKDRLLINDIIKYSDVGSIILDDSLNSPYSILKDNGILLESISDDGDVSVRFYYDRILEYALAMFLLKKLKIDKTTWLLELARGAKSFSPLWGAIKYILLSNKDLSLFETLGKSEDLTIRAIAIDSLVTLSNESTPLAINFCKRMLESETDLGIRTALDAAYQIGYKAKDVFIAAAASTSEDIRNVNKWYLYSLWKQDPEFCFKIVDELIPQINIWSLSKAKPIASSIIDFWSTVFMNNCWKPDVISRIANQINKLFLDQLHFNRINNLPFSKQLWDIGFSAGSRAFSKKIIEAITFADYFPIESFFSEDTENKHTYNELVPLLAPESELTEKDIQNIKKSLDEEFLFYRVVPVLILVGHVLYDFARYEKTAREIYNKLSPSAKYWFICGFSIFLPIQITDQYIKFLENLTDNFIENHRKEFINPTFENLHFFPELDLLFLPLGLAYQSRKSGLQFIERYFVEEMAALDQKFISRIINCIAPLGLYYPDEVLNFIFDRKNILIPNHVESVTTTLASLRTIFLEKVDAFMEKIDLDSKTRQIVFSKTEVKLIEKTVYGVGLLNNVVNMMLWHHKMREVFAFDLYEILGTSKNMQEFLYRYSRGVVTIFIESDWNYLNIMDFDTTKIAL